MAFDALVEAVATMRMLRSAHVMPVVNLGQRKWKSKKWGWQTRPDFEIIGYKTPGGGAETLPAEPTAPQLTGPAKAASPPPASNPTDQAQVSAATGSQPKASVKLADETLAKMDDVKPVTTSEIMKDEVQW
jgi:hypothetical protein